MRFTILAATIIMAISCFTAVADEGQNVTVGKGLLSISGYLQTGFLMNNGKLSIPQYDDTGAFTGYQETTTNTSTFKVRRARVKLNSEIIEKIVGGTMEYDFVDSSMKEIYFWFSPQWEPLKLLIGREKLPFMLENMTSAGEQTWVDRSIVADKFGHEYDYGLRFDLNYPLNEKNNLLVGLMFSNGYNTLGQEQATDFDSDFDKAVITGGAITSFQSKRTDLKDIAARLAWNGNLSDDFKLGIGAAVMMDKATSFDTAANTLTTLARQPITADVTAAYTNLSIYGSYSMDAVKNTTDVYGVDTTDPTVYTITTAELKDDLTGMMGGIAYMFPIEGTPLLTGIEPAVRYASYTDKQKITATDVDHSTQDTEITQIAAGVNFIMMAKHNAKFQLNYVVQNEKDSPYAPSDPTDPSSPYVKKDPTKIDDGKIQLQFQIKF